MYNCTMPPQLQQSGWGELPLKEGEPAAVSIGPLLIWAQLKHSEVWIAHKTDAGPEASPPPDSDPAWSRWALSTPPASLRISPALPPRSLVVQPEYAFRLSIGAEARIYVRIPLWAAIRAAPGPARPLLEAEAAILSNTWFGDFQDGELCYWLSTGARRAAVPSPDRPHLALCPISIKNVSGEELLIEKLRLQVAALRLYQSPDGQIWTSDMRVIHSGEEGSKVEVLKKAPVEAPQAALLAEARHSAREHFTSRTFGRLLSFTGLVNGN